ncbi:MAG: putative fluoride ion transporter CrcB [Candidatus Ordinivivax streblomastigis]|uniref:Fluoride-specific ion channel FluC n=1 Tax=Candidatus Ordinivivax streblomastigis TaxID=2540710 RepID=A0A5M8P2Q6_9BACT|nr:MAG: putative fluoride ion transporter CrcB [Candidatus Ordinivivax streblomastigis]
MLKQLLLIGLGGGTGSIFRFLVSHFTTKVGANTFPTATFIVNILGCLLIGLFTGWMLKFQWFDTPLKYLLITGFCGGFTTFSTFSLENLQLYQSGQYISLTVYILASVVCGLAAVFGGMMLVK